MWDNLFSVCWSLTVRLFFPFKSVTRVIAGEVSSLSFCIMFRRVDYSRKRSEIHNDLYYLWINHWTQLDNWQEAQIQRQGTLGKAPRRICLFDTHQMRRTTTESTIRWISINSVTAITKEGRKNLDTEMVSITNRGVCSRALIIFAIPWQNSSLPSNSLGLLLKRA